jgi:nicotinate-nucleotide pyrophosphorylase (carboxylating)
MINIQDVQPYLQSALSEDIGSGDHSTLSCIDEHARGVARLKIKEDCVLAGVEIAEIIFRMVEQDINLSRHLHDGDAVVAGDTAFEVEAKIHTILSCERLVLNTMQRMSGIATLTRQYTEKLKGFKTKLLDTRKTTPNFRIFEKEAVRIGGGYNHRFGLYDMIMLKDNHIDYCGSISKALHATKSYLVANHLDLKIEVETRNLEEVREALDTGIPHRIMLDNFNPDAIRSALDIIKGRVETEASGGIRLDNLTEYAATGVDFISSGAVIHQAKSVDLSLKASIKSER